MVKDDLSSDCVSRSKELAVQLREACLKQRSAGLPGSTFDYNQGTYDDHDNGIWRGWVKMAPLKGDLPKVTAYFLDLDAHRGTVTFKQQGGSSLEKVRVTYIEFLCKNKGICKVQDYSVHKAKPDLVA